MLDKPCLDCKDRKEYCHSTCERYAGMKVRLKKINDNYRQYMDGRGHDTNLAPKSKIKN